MEKYVDLAQNNFSSRKETSGFLSFSCLFLYSLIVSCSGNGTGQCIKCLYELSSFCPVLSYHYMLTLSDKKVQILGQSSEGLAVAAFPRK